MQFSSTKIPTLRKIHLTCHCYFVSATEKDKYLTQYMASLASQRPTQAALANGGAPSSDIPDT